MIEDARKIQEMYLTLGIGGLSFIALLVLLIYIVRSIVPMLNKMDENIKSSSSITKEVLENNSKVILEISKSNNNVAEALNLLQENTKNIGDGLSTLREDNTSQHIKQNENMLIIRERIRGVGEK